MITESKEEEEDERRVLIKNMLDVRLLFHRVCGQRSRMANLLAVQLCYVVVPGQ